jgi:hypothetical protein
MARLEMLSPGGTFLAGLDTTMRQREVHADHPGDPLLVVQN